MVKRIRAKFIECSNEHPKTRGRPPKHYHPLLEKENELYTKVHNILPKSSLILSALKGQDFLICMVYPRLTSLNCPWDQFYRRLIHTITHLQNGWKKNLSLCQPMLTRSVISFNSPKISETSLLMLTTYSYHCHENLNFTMEIAKQDTISFVVMNITKCGNRLETSIHRKSTNTGLLLNYHSHVDKQYKRCLLSTMINRAYRLSSTPTAFSEECDKLWTDLSKPGLSCKFHQFFD